MRWNKLASKAEQSLISAIIWGVAAAIILSVLLTVLVSSLALDGRIDEKNIAVMVAIIRMLSVMIGGVIGGLITKRKYILQVSLTTLCYLLIMLGIGVAFYGGSLGRLLNGVVTASLGGALALLILAIPKKRSHRAINFSS